MGYRYDDYVGTGRLLGRDGKAGGGIRASALALGSSWRRRSLASIRRSPIVNCDSVRPSQAGSVPATDCHTAANSVEGRRLRSQTTRTTSHRTMGSVPDDDVQYCWKHRVYLSGTACMLLAAGRGGAARRVGGVSGGATAFSGLAVLRGGRGGWTSISLGTTTALDGRLGLTLSRRGRGGATGLVVDGLSRRGESVCG